MHLILKQLKAYPLTVIASLIAAVIAFILPDTGPDAWWLMPPLYTAMMCIPLGVSLSLYFKHNSTPLKWKTLTWVVLIAALLGIFYPISLPSVVGNFSSTIPVFLLCIAAVGSTFTLPLLAKAFTSAQQWEYIKRLVFQYLITVFVSVGLLMLCMWFLGAIENMFSLEVYSQHLYERISTTVALLFAPLFMITMFPDPEELQQENIPALLRIIGLWILSPLAIIYAGFLILNLIMAVGFGYTLEGYDILPPVFIYFGITFTLIYVLFPILREVKHKALTVIFVILHIIFALMGAWTIYFDILAGGIDISLYTTIAALLTLLGLTAAVAHRGVFQLKYHAIIPVIILIISSVGPFSATNTVVSYQKSIVHNVLSHHQQDVVSASDLSTEEMHQVNDALITIRQHGGTLSEFESRLSQEDFNFSGEHTYKNLSENIPNNYCTRHGTRLAYLDFNTPGYYFPDSNGATSEANKSNITVETIEKNNEVLVNVTLGELSESFNITTQLNTILGTECTDQKSISEEDSIIRLEQGNMGLVTYIQYINRDQESLHGEFSHFVYKIK